MPEINQYVKQKKLQKLLSDCIQSVEAGRIHCTYEVHGLKWVMQPLCDHESNWRNKYVIPGSLISIQTSMKAPTLAIGIRAIGSQDSDPEPIEEFFKEEWEKLEKQARYLLENNSYAKQYFIAEMLMEWLAKRGPDFIDKLWDKWNEMVKEQEEAEKKLGESLEAKKLSHSSLITNTGSSQSSIPSHSLVTEDLSSSLEVIDTI